MKRIATTLAIVCLTIFLSGCGKSQPSSADDSGDAKVNTAPPTVSLGSGSSEPDDGSTNPFEDEGNKPSASDSNPATAQKPKDEEKLAPGNQKPAVKETKK